MAASLSGCPGGRSDAATARQRPQDDIVRQTRQLVYGNRRKLRFPAAAGKSDTSGYRWVRMKIAVSRSSEFLRIQRPVVDFAAGAEPGIELIE
jgi:hypothetical protein